jgi:tetratricopeptide (TPR) repeat protein
VEKRPPLPVDDVQEEHVMGLTARRWIRYAGLAAMATLVLACGDAAVSEESSSDQAVVNMAAEEPAALPAADAARPATTIPDPPTLAPRRQPAASPPAESGLEPSSVQISPATDPLEVKLRTDSPQQPAGEPAVASESAPLEPIPDSQASMSVEIGTASFNGIVPGATTLAKLQEAWGSSSKIAKRGDSLVYLYSVDPFERVEVSVLDDKVTSIVIRLDRTFPAATVAEQLDLTAIRPVLISNPLGEILGQAFPERGVLFAFTPGEDPMKASMEVAQIILEPVVAEPFVLRAETYFDEQLELTVADLEQAIQLDGEDARAQWLLARALAAVGERASALEAAAESVRLAPTDAQYQTTYAQILGQAERFEEAIEEARKAAANGQQRPHILARTWCLLGDLSGSGPHPDYKQAIEYHMKAIQAAELLAEDPHPAIRLTAKEVLLDAHLGAAHDVAWGDWNQKETAVPRWLNRAAELAEKLTDDEARSNRYRFRVSQRAMAAYVGLQGKLDPTPWTEEVLRTADAAIASAQGSLKKQQVLLDLGTALYDGVQVYQLRGEYDVAMKCGEQAVQCFEQVAKAKEDAAADDYLLGRLYFRLGAILAIGKHDHEQAVRWFDKAEVAFGHTAAQLGPEESGRLGETLVSMGVSYWETGQHEKAAQLTARGAKLIEKAVDDGALDRSALEIPYGNLAAMQRSDKSAAEGEPAVQNARRDPGTALK